MSISKQSKLSEEEVLLAFSVEPRRDRETLTRYLKDYPEYSAALTDLSIELMIEDTREETAVFPSTEAVDRAWEKFSNALEFTDDASVMNPFSNLNATQLKKVADKIGINKLMLVRLRDRGIDFSTIPSRFIETAAASLGVTIDTLKSYLSGPPKIASGLSFRSDVKPKPTDQISFAEAIELSQLTSQQQAEMKKLMEN